MKNIQVVKLGKGTALVKTRGLRRLFHQPGNKICMELVELETAKDLVKSAAHDHKKGHPYWLTMEKYPQ